MPVSDPNRDKQNELKIQRQIGFTAGLFQEDVTVRTLLESLAEGVIIIDNSGVILLVNARAEQMFGYPKQELIGKPHSILIPERFRKIHEEHQTLYFQEPSIRPMGQLLHLFGLRRDGSEFTLEISLSFIDTINGVLVLALISDITLRKQMEQTLQQSEDLFHLQLESVKGYAIYTLDAEGKVLNWNVGAEHLRGYRAEEIIGKHSDCFYTEEDRKAGKPADNLNKAEAEGRFEEEGWRLRMDGSRFWAEVIITVLRDGKGNLCGFSNVTRDISERKLVEDALKLQQHLMVNAERLANVGSWEWDIDENLWTFSDNWLHISGVGLRTMSVEDLLPIAHPDDRAKVERAFEDALQNGKPYDIQHRIIRQDTGEVRYMLAFGELTTDEMGQRRLIGVVQDVTERKHAEEALRESEGKYRTLFDESFDGLFITSPSGKILDMNKKGIAMFGYDTKEEVLSLDLERDIYAYAPDRRRILAMIDAQGTSEYEVVVKKKSGETMVTHCSLTAVKDETGKTASYRGIVRDISEKKQAEEALHRLNRELRAISNCNQAMVRAENEQSLINDICRIVCDEAGYRMAWVGYAENDDAKTISPVAWAGVEDGYLTETRLTWADAGRGHGPTGTAIRSGESAYSHDFASDPQTAPWRDSALQRGYRSTIALPLKDQHGSTFGIFNIYSSEQNAFTPDETRLMEELAGDLAFGINALRARVERKHAEEALRESEERFRLMANAAPVMIWESGPDARCTFFNTSWLEFTGRSLEQELGDGWKQGVHPGDLERCVDVYLSAVKDRSGFSMEYRLRRADGGYGWIFNTGVPRLAQNGDLLGYIGSCFDITERKQAKEELQQANELLTQRVAERTAELSDTIESLKDEIDQRVRMGEALQEETTERLNAQVELREKELLLLQQSRLAAMGEMIGNIAHQWRQPLNMLGLLAQDLAMTYRKGEFSTEYLEGNVKKVLETIHHMSKTIDDFRNFFRPDKEKTVFRILEVIEKTISLLEVSLNAQQIKTSVTSACDPVVNGYPNEFAQVLLNVMVNARDALVTQQVTSPTITIEIGTEDGRSVVTITDNAGGIPENIIDRIFDPYFTTKGPDKGTGVGLYMSKIIIEKNMNGFLTARNVEGGAQFRIVV